MKFFIVLFFGYIRRMAGRTFNIIYWQSFELISAIITYTFKYFYVSQKINFIFVPDTIHILYSFISTVPDLILYIYFLDTFKEWHLGQRRFFPIPLNSFPQSSHIYSPIVASPEISTSNISPTLHMLITSGIIRNYTKC